MTGISRRKLLIGGAGAALIGAFGTLDGLPAVAGPLGSDPVPGAQLSTDVQWITGYDTTAYVTYMHQNGYFQGCRYFACRQSLTLGGPNYLHVYDRVTETSFRVPDRAPDREMLGGYLDVSRSTGLLLNAETPTQALRDSTRPRIWAYDLNEHLATGSSIWVQIYQVPVGATIADTAASINAAGTHIALSELYGPPASPEIPGDQISKIVKVDIATGRRDVLVERETLHNHVHFCPYDEDWIVFSREGDSTLHKERVWAHHPVHAPSGANVVPQILSSGQVLRLSHERASWNAATVVVVNYENPRGVWRGFLDGSEPELLANGRFEHCDVSRDGRFVVVDTSLTGSAMSIQVIDTTGQIPITTVVPDTNRGVDHPRHNHPIFSPDGRYVLFNDPDPADVNAGGLRIGIVDLRAFGYPV